MGARAGTADSRAAWDGMAWDLPEAPEALETVQVRVMAKGLRLEVKRHWEASLGFRMTDRRFKTEQP